MDAERAGFEVPLRRGHAPMRALHGLAFLAIAGYLGWIAIVPDGKVQPANFGSILIALFGVAAAGFGLHSLVLGWLQTLHPRPGLRVDVHGIHDNSRGDGGRFIAWADIDDFESARDEDNVLTLFACRQGVPPPDLTIVPAILLGDGVQRREIASANLAIDHDELHGVLRRHLALHRQRRDARA